MSKTSTKKNKQKPASATKKLQGATTARNTHTMHAYGVLVLLTLTFIGSIMWFMNPPVITKGETLAVVAPSIPNSIPGKHVVVHLDSGTLELHDGPKTLVTYPLITQGKPGSYYETIGGSYLSDYKIPLHFSSIGHVYMPYSVHLFGNYFIHGIPYYADGTQVSSTYSGGCIRLSNENAKIVYDFITKDMPIIVTREGEFAFTPTAVSTSTMASMTMTTYMVASISLEALTQDNEILGSYGTTTTRRALLPKLVRDQDPTAAHSITERIGEPFFVELMNQKAVALGLTNTHFTDISSPVTTSYEDYMRFMAYIRTYKSYLGKVVDSRI